MVIANVVIILFLYYKKQILKMINLPGYLRESVVLTHEEKDKLASIAVLPSDAEVDEIRTMPAIQELLNAFIGDETTRQTHIQLKAKDYLLENNVEMAWKVLFL